MTIRKRKEEPRKNGKGSLDQWIEQGTHLAALQPATGSGWDSLLPLHRHLWKSQRKWHIYVSWCMIFSLKINADFQKGTGCLGPCFYIKTEIDIVAVLEAQTFRVALQIESAISCHPSKYLLWVIMERNVNESYFNVSDFGAALYHRADDVA